MVVRYDSASNLVAAVNPLGYRATTVFDKANRVVASINALGYRSTTVCDAANNVIASIDAEDKRTTTQPDGFQRSHERHVPLRRLRELGHEQRIHGQSIPLCRPARLLLRPRDRQL
jgi:YD repeat-containing protein